MSYETLWIKFTSRYLYVIFFLNDPFNEPINADKKKKENVVLGRRNKTFPGFYEFK